MFIDKVSASIKDYQDDIDRSNEIVSSIDKDFSEFLIIAEDVKKDILDVSKSFDFYLNQFLDKNIELMKKVGNIEDKINSLNELSNRMIENCKYDLNNSSMDSKCSSFEKNYVNMIASFKTMVDKYNSVVDTYNAYAKRKNVKAASLFEPKLNDVDNILEAIK